MAKVIKGIALTVMGVFAFLSTPFTGPLGIIAGNALIGIGVTLIASGLRHAQMITSQMMIRQPISFRRIVYGNVRVRRCDDLHRAVWKQ